MAVIGIRDRLLDRPTIYAAWQAPFAARKFAPVQRRIRTERVGRVLDVGCGPGTNARWFSGADYVGVDVNERYLALARSRYAGRFVHADLTTADLSSLGRFDTILVNSFLHHLPDDAAARVLAQLGAALDCAGIVHVLELVLPERPTLARLMAKLDRGKYARPLAAWLELFRAEFRPVVEEPYALGGGLWSMVYFQGRSRE